MAYSLVKDDPDLAATAALWRDLPAGCDDTYPDAVLLPESDIEAPVDLGVRSGFDGDFFLVNQAAHSALFNNGGAGSLPWLPDHEHCFFDADGPDGPGSLGTFLAIWDEHQAGNGAGPPGRAGHRPTTTSRGWRRRPDGSSSSAPPSRSC